jgi:hypothetical protein
MGKFSPYIGENRDGRVRVLDEETTKFLVINEDVNPFLL